MKRLIILVVCVAVFAGCESETKPKSYGPLPSERQLAWQEMEYYMFVHFGPNTFTNVQWGDGNEDPKVFAPTALDCDQWAATARMAGMKGIIITAKHHDGFCLWPSEFSTHTVREAGQPDILKLLSEACAREGLKFGVYVSPWDQNHPSYGTPEYNDIFAGTLREVLTNYGPVFEQWLDGANGEGPNGKRQEYDWDLFHRTIRECQPGAIIFSDVGPDVRWMGNERGVAGETNWSRLDIEGFTPGHGAPPTDTLNQGNIHGASWVPAEVDVSIRKGWFYSAEQDSTLKSVEKLEEIWLTSVGRNANLLLNVPPDRTGRINPMDSARLMEFRAILDATYSNDLAKDATIKKDKNVIEVVFSGPVTFDRLQLGEDISLGQCVEKWHAEYFDGEAWKPLCEGTTIGYKRIVAFERITSERMRVYIDSTLAPEQIDKIGLFLRP